MASTAPVRGFDPAAMFGAIEAAREARGMSWAGVASEMREDAEALHADLEGRVHPIAVSTITGLRTGKDTSCQHALVMLRWLRRPPEDFVGAPAPGTTGVPLPEPGPEYMIRWDLKATYEALDAVRREHGATWAQAAHRLHCTEGQLRGLRTARYATRMRLAMRIAQALRRPAADFVIAAKW